MKPIRPADLQGCRPPSWALGSHLQTIIPHLLPAPKPIAADLLAHVDLGDGDFLSVEVHKGRLPVQVYLFHGLAGSVHSDYMIRTTALCRMRGYWVNAVNHRGCGVGRGLASKPYHSGAALDVSRVLERGRARFPDHLHIALGFSLSGNALLLLLSGVRGGVQPDYAIAVNAPIELESAAIKMKTGFNRLYDLRFVRRLRRTVQERYRMGLIGTRYPIPPLCTLHDFDNIYTAPEGGFEDREDYYRTCSTLNFLDRINTPTVLLTSKDDPLVDYRNYVNAGKSPSILFHLEDHGGHMGYFCDQPTPLGTRRWLDHALDRYLSQWTAGLV